MYVNLVYRPPHPHTHTLTGQVSGAKSTALQPTRVARSIDGQNLV